MKYIAYGSNMVENQMAMRCPNAKLIGMGTLPNHRLEFYRHATVEPDDTCAEGVPVAVWEISDTDERRLDFYEGFPYYYSKEEATVHMADSSEIKGMVYVMNNGYKEGTPAKQYYDDICRAYEKLGLGPKISTVLESALKNSRERNTSDHS